MRLIFVLLALVLLVEAGSFRLPLSSRKTSTLSLSMGRKLVKDSSKVFDRATWHIPMQGNLTYWGEFFALVGLGSPPQYVPLQVDTGSADLIVYTKDCDGCNSTATYDPDSSSSSQEIMCDNSDYDCYTPFNDCDGTDPCAWEDDFGDGSTIDGQVYEDYITIAGITDSMSSISLGGITSVDAPNGFEAFGVDGIWGLAFSALSGWQGQTAISVVISDYNLYDSFDMCLATQPGGNGGILAIGDNYAKDARFQWTDIVQDQWYTVYMTNWFIGHTSLGVPAYDLNWDGVIVDSGTTLIIVPYWIMDPIKKILTGMCANTTLVGICGVKTGQSLFDGQCYSMTTEQVAAFPPMSFSFTGISSLDMTPDDYLWQGAGEPGVYCMGIQQMDNLGVILGDVLIQRYHVIFDREQDKVGFGPLSSCPQ